MNSSDEFDVVAIAFRRMTGHHRPGKDVAAAAGYSMDFEARSEIFGVWMKAYGPCVVAMLAAFREIAVKDAAS